MSDEASPPARKNSLLSFIAKYAAQLMDDILNPTPIYQKSLNPKGCLIYKCQLNQIYSSNHMKYGRIGCKYIFSYINQNKRDTMHKNHRYRQILSVVAIIMITATLLTYSIGFAQPTQALTEDWRNSDYAFNSSMMDTDQNNNVFVLGDTAVGNYLEIKKFDPSGSLLWETTYNPVERLVGTWLAVDNNGDAIMLASMISGNNNTPSGWLILKYDKDGNLLWFDSLPGPFYYASRVEVDSSNNIYVAGSMWLTNPFGNTTHDSVLKKYSPSGSTLWTAVFDNNSAVDRPTSLVISPDSTRIGIAGVSGNMFMALMYDSEGNQLWANTDSNIYPANDLAFGTGNISYFAAGTYFPADPNPYQMAIVKFDAAGNQSWVKSYNVGDRAFYIGVDPAGNVVATGMDAVGYMDWMTIKTDADGNLLWSQRYDGGKNNDETPNMLAIDASGAVYITGKGGPNPSSGNISYVKGVLVKYNSDGTPEWAVWDDYANGKAFRIGTGDTLATLAWAYLVTTHYTQTGLPDLAPNAPTNLTGYASFTGSQYNVILSFNDNANNEFWVEAERCTGEGCTDFTRVAQTLGENSTTTTDLNVPDGVTYTYRVRAMGFMGGSSYSNTIEITVPNSPPVAGPDAYTTGVNTPLVVPIPGVLNNDTDPDGDPLIAILDTGVSHGLLALDPNGSFVYTPTLSYIGLDSFTYRANDGIDNSNLAIVSIAVTGTNTPPDALDDTSTAPEDVPVTVDVLANDSDADGDTLSISGVTQPANGTAIIQGNGVLYTSYLNYYGSDSFTYTITDGHGGTDTANISIDVTPVNDPPVANNDTYTTTQGSSLIIYPPGILQNDIDVDGDPLTPVLITDVSNGTLALAQDGSFIYDPAAGFNGTDQFTYLVSDGTGNSSPVTVTIEVTSLPLEYQVFLALLIR
jgi:hypothetical protein